MIYKTFISKKNKSFAALGIFDNSNKVNIDSVECPILYPKEISITEILSNFFEDMSEEVEITDLDKKELVKMISSEYSLEEIEVGDSSKSFSEKDVYMFARYYYDFKNKNPEDITIAKKVFKDWLIKGKPEDWKKDI